MVAGSNPAVPTPNGAVAVPAGRTSGRGRFEGPLETIWLLVGIIGFMVMIAAFFFGGFLILDFLFARRGGDR